MSGESFGDLFDKVGADANDSDADDGGDGGGGVDDALNNGEVKKKTKRKKQPRSLKLIAEFDDEGFAVGWFFAVSTAFKDVLDIRYTERKEPVLDENGEFIYVSKIDKNGRPYQRKKTRPVMRWTQGVEYSFIEGHAIYDNPKAYSPTWSESLKHFKLRIQVTAGTPTAWNEIKGKAVGGSVTFKLERPNSDRTGLEMIGQYHMTQAGFVEYLKSGDLEKHQLKDDRGFEQS